MSRPLSIDLYPIPGSQYSASIDFFPPPNVTCTALHFNPHWYCAYEQAGGKQCSGMNWSLFYT